MDACRKYGVKGYIIRQVQMKYMAILLFTDLTCFFREDISIHTGNPCFTPKASADLLVLAYYATYCLPVTISRCSNNYGPYEFPENLVSLMIHNAAYGNSLPAYGEGLNVH